MTLLEVKNKLKELNLPLAYHHFEKEDPPEPPFVVFLITGKDNLHADNETYIKIKNLDVELYTDEKSEDLEEQLEAKLDEMKLPYTSDEGYIESEKLYLIRYETQLIGG